MTLFEKIIQGEIPAYKVAETERYLAFLDINPLQEGHTLVIPKKPVDYLFDLDEDLYIGLQLFAKRVALALNQVVDCKRIGVSVIGLEVPHAHIHLVPISDVGDIDFNAPKNNLDPEIANVLASKIREKFNALPA